MFEAANDFFAKHGDAVDQLVLRYAALEKQLLLRSEVVELVEVLREVRAAEFLREKKRVFREESGEVVPHWISRFQVWPYLERFATVARYELAKEAGQDPDFIIGNYSDGNLVWR